MTTNFALWIAIAASLLGLLVLLVRRVTPRSPGTVDMSNITVSRQWLIQHQTHDRS
jgi:hypothetical protein